MRTFSRQKAASALALLAVFIYVYQKRGAFFQIAAVFAFAGAFTLILSPLCRMLENRGLQTKIAAAVCVLGFVLAAVLILAAFIPYLISHTIDLVRRMTPTLTALLQQGDALLQQFGIAIQQQTRLTDMIATAMSRLTTLLARGSVSFAAQTGQFVFSLVIAYYMLCERVRIANHLILLLPLPWRTAFLCAMLGCKNAVLGYLSGVLKTSLFVALATFAGLFVLGVRDALLLSMFMGLFEILPYIGPVLAAIPIVLTTLSQGFYRALLSLGVVLLVQQIEGNFISPYFTASSTSIHPLAALLSVFIMGSLMGLWGILLAVPIVVTLRSALWSLRQASNLMKA